MSKTSVSQYAAKVNKSALTAKKIMICHSLNKIEDLFDSLSDEDQQLAISMAEKLMQDTFDIEGEIIRMEQDRLNFHGACQR